MCDRIDTQREELEAEFFARYDSEKWNYSALDPETEALGDNEPPSSEPEVDLDDVPF